MSKQVQTAIPQSDIAVKLTGVTKTYEQWQRTGQGKNILKNLIKPEKKIVKALDNISFHVNTGEFVAYAGPNGAGKSTTMKLLCGMLVPGEGSIEVLGLSPQKQRIALMKRVGVLFGNRTELWWDHPVTSSFEWKRVVWDIPTDEFKKMRDKVVELLDIGNFVNTFARELSLGQRMRADLAMMLLHQPELILLDEPTLGLDVLAKRQMISFLKELNRELKTTIIVTSHDMDDLEEMAQRILLISNGKITYDGGFDNLHNAAGGLCRVVLTMKDGIVPELACGKLLSQSYGICEYEVDIGKTPIRSVLSEIAAIEDVLDIEMRKSPIEEIIAGLYNSWNVNTETSGTIDQE